MEIKTFIFLELNVGFTSNQAVDSSFQEFIILDPGGILDGPSAPQAPKKASQDPSRAQGGSPQPW